MNTIRLPVPRLRWLIALAFAGLATSMIAGVCLVIEHEGARRIRATQDERLRDTADLLAAAFSRHLHERWQFMRALHEGSQLGRAATTEETRAEISGRARRFFPDFTLIGITGADAVVRLGDPRAAIGRQLGDRSIDLATGHMVLAAAIDGATRIPVPTFWLPLTEAGLEGRSLVSQLDWSILSKLEEFAMLGRRPDDGSHVLLVAPDTVIDLSADQTAQIDATAEDRSVLAALSPTPRMISWEGSEHAGVRVPVLAAGPAHPIPLDLVVLQDVEAALRPIHELRRTVIESGASFVALATVLGWLLAHWIAAPLDRIARAARDDAPLDAVPASSRYAEIGELAHALSRLLARTREEGARLASAFATSLDGVLVLDDKGVLGSINPAAERMFGPNAKAALGGDVRLLLPEPRCEDDERAGARALPSAEHRIAAIGKVRRGRRMDGTTFPCEVTTGRSTLADGSSIVTVFVHDTSEAVDSARRLQRARAEIDRMHRLSAVSQVGSQLSHELNQPLGAISNYGQAARQLLLAETSAGARRIDGLLEKLLAQVARASGIVQQLRRFVASAGTQRSRCDVNAMIRESIALATASPAFERLRVATRLERTLPSLELDRVEIQQVLANLIVNAGEAMADAPDGRIEIRSRRDDGHVVIEIADRGPGIDPAISDRLFTPFATTKPRGLGLGLAICRTIVEAHDGEISATPNPGGGTVFAIRLPLGVAP